MRGHVASGGREAVVALRVLGPAGGLSRSDSGRSRGEAVEVEAVVDTGFTGHPTLPPRLVRSLSLPLPQRGFLEVELADGNTAALGVYDARVFWHGLSRPIPVYEADGGPLVGMSLLRGSRLTVEVVPGDSLVIEALD